MTTQESTPTFARDVQPLFRARDRATRDIRSEKPLSEG